MLFPALALQSENLRASSFHCRLGDRKWRVDPDLTVAFLCVPSRLSLISLSRTIST